MELRACRKCGTEYPLTDYYLDKRRNSRFTECKPCKIKYETDKRNTRPGRIKDCHGHARQKGYEFDLTRPWLDEIWNKQNGRCALTGQILSPESFSPNLATIDRIDNTRGYTKDNVRWTIWPINRMKRDMTEDEFLSLIYATADYTRNKTTLHCSAA